MKTPACPVALAKVGPVVQSRPVVFLFGTVQKGVVPWVLHFCLELCSVGKVFQHIVLRKMMTLNIL